MVIRAALSDSIKLVHGFESSRREQAQPGHPRDLLARPVVAVCITHDAFIRDEVTDARGFTGKTTRVWL